MRYSTFTLVLKLFLLFIQTVELDPGETLQHDFVLECLICQDSCVTLAETLTRPHVA